jgi:hypothetical protein
MRWAKEAVAINRQKKSNRAFIKNGVRRVEKSGLLPLKTSREKEPVKPDTTL